MHFDSLAAGLNRQYIDSLIAEALLQTRCKFEFLVVDRRIGHFQLHEQIDVSASRRVIET